MSHPPSYRQKLLTVLQCHTRDLDRALSFELLGVMTVSLLLSDNSSTNGVSGFDEISNSAENLTGVLTRLAPIPYYPSGVADR